MLLIVQADDGIDDAREITVQAGRQNDLGEVRLELPATAVLQLIDRDGDAVDGEVALVDREEVREPGRWSRRAARTGYLALGRPRYTAEGRLLVDADRLAEAVVCVRRSPVWETYTAEQRGRHHWVVKLRDLQRTVVSVVDQRGFPVLNANVSVHRYDRGDRSLQAPVPMRLQLEGFGSWALPPLPKFGRYAVLASEADHAPGWHADGPLGERVTVVLGDALGPTALRVTTRDGRPAPSATVSIRPAGNFAFIAEEPIEVGSTDESGSLLVDGLWRSTFELTVRHPEFGVAEQEIDVSAAGQAFTVLLQTAMPADLGTLVGTVRQQGGAPATRWWIEAVSAGDRRKVVRTDDDGGFVLRDLPAGACRLRAFDQPPSASRWRGDELLRQDAWVLAGATQHTILTADDVRGRLIRGRVLLNGLVVDDLVVAVERPAAERERRFDRPGLRRTARVDAYGDFALRAPASGDLELSVLRSHRGEVQKLHARSLPDRATELLLDLDLDVGSADLQLLSASGAVLARTAFRARLLDADTELAYDVVSDAMGQVFLEQIPVGTYELTPATPGRSGAAGRARVVVARQRTLTLTVTMPQ